MFQVLTNVQTGEAISLQQYIDNRGCQLRVGLQSLSWWVGWWNWPGGEAIQYKQSGGYPSDFTIPGGLYPEEDISEALTGLIPGLEVSVGKHDGIAKITVPSGYEIMLSDQLCELYGLDDAGWLDDGVYNGDRPVNFSPYQEIGIKLHQLNTTTNVVDGSPSNILTFIEPPNLGFGKIWSLKFPHPEMKLLQDGAITELKLELVDKTGRRIDNHSLPISATLVIA